METLKSKIIVGFIMILMLVATISSIYFWYKERNKAPVSTIEYIKVPEIKETIKIKKVEVPGPEKIITIEKKVIVEKLKLPDWFKADDNKQAIATATIAPYEGNTNAIAILDTKTGVGDIIVKQEPLSFMGFVNEKEIYFKLGYTTSKQPQAALGGRWLFARVGKVKIGAFAEGCADFAVDENKTDGKMIGGLMIKF